MASAAKRSGLVQKNMVEMKKVVRKLIRQGRIAEAKKGLQQYMEQRPDDMGNFALAGVILIMEGSLAEAEKVLLEGLKRDPGNCDLLFNLGFFLDEQRKEFLSALDLYRRAELAAGDSQQQEDVKDAVRRVLEQIRGTIVFKGDTYTIILEGNSRQLKETPGLTYEDSVLKAYYDRFTPNNRQEQLFEDEEEKLSPLNEGWTLLPWMDSKGVKINSKVSFVTRFI